MTEQPTSPPPSEPAATAGRGKGLRSAIFAVVVGGVLVGAAVLGSQGGAIPMPSNHPELGKQHQLRVNLKGELVGLEMDPPVDPTAASQTGFKHDKRAAEKAVNGRCKECHATLPPHHPPKQECIKCHREAQRGAPWAGPLAKSKATAKAP